MDEFIVIKKEALKKLFKEFEDYNYLGHEQYEFSYKEVLLENGEIKSREKFYKRLVDTEPAEIKEKVFGGYDTKNCLELGVGRCFTCKHLKHGCGEEVCGSEERYKWWKENVQKPDYMFNFNSLFSPVYDGDGCDFYEVEL